MRVLRKRLSNCVCVCVCPSFPFGIEGRLWDVIVIIPDHCLSIYFIGQARESQHIQTTSPLRSEDRFYLSYICCSIRLGTECCCCFFSMNSALLYGYYGNLRVVLHL